MDELTLTGHLLELSRAVDDYRAATRKMETHFAEQIERLWQDSAERRDELNESVNALSNRIEAVQR